MCLYHSTPVVHRAQPQSQVILKTLFLSSPDLAQPIVVDLTQAPAELQKLKNIPGESRTRWLRSSAYFCSHHQRSHRVFGRHYLCVRLNLPPDALVF